MIDPGQKDTSIFTAAEHRSAPPPVLEYQAPASEIEPSILHLMTPRRFAGLFFGTLCSFLVRAWDRWAENITRVPLLWYQHEQWIGVAALILIGLTWAFFRSRFFGAFAMGLCVGVGIIVIDEIIQSAYRAGFL